MKTLRQLIETGGLNKYMSLLADATAPYVPADALFMIVVMERDGTGAHYVSNAKRGNVAERLRDLANALETDQRREQGEAEKN